ncbi:WD40 repeat-like protein [Meira miltonrushii]|uniref:WD40 repeat-like protein n=1 Tax=Meira miltonrushii TaxID=1280837 RepID=A0A316VDB2_9BASI|nr:WD40 repeat-like protein [Meira miltonrushii]PWN35480.1 WD40 repeat-like protein [Meira miltonrushii]
MNSLNGNHIPSDAHQIAHASIAEFLDRNGYTSTLEAFQQEASKKVGWTWNNGEGESSTQATLDEFRLENIIEKHQSILSSAKQRRANELHRLAAQRSPLDLSLAGPSKLPFRLKDVYSKLHASNILSLSLVDLPNRSFSTSEARYISSTKRLICSTGADRNIIFSDPVDGEMVESFEGGQGQLDQAKHAAAVLCTAQNPNKQFQREFVTCGMDSKVIVWDLLHGKAIQLIQTHSKFVVRCAFSQSGQYLATCSYDKTICVFKRNGEELPRNVAGDEEDDLDMPPLLKTQYTLVHTVKTRNNPESIVFVRSALSPDQSDPGTEETQTALVSQTGVPAVSDSPSILSKKRTWLAYTMRSDCFVHYLALPLDADEERAPGEEASGEGIEAVSSKLGELNVTEQDTQNTKATPEWTELAFNTNASRSDYHVSYSLLHLTLHPLGNHLAIQTGDHSIPSTGYAPASSSLSRIIIMPLLSSERTTTIWTGVASSGFAANRHVWLKDGSAVWLTSEDGILRLVDTHGKTRATVYAHGIAASAGESNGSANLDTEMRSASSWSRGGNTIIKDVVVLDDEGSVASCGFDHTVRVTSLEQS